MIATSEFRDEWEEYRHKRFLETRRPVEIEIHEMYGLYLGREGVVLVLLGVGRRSVNMLVHVFF